MYRGVNAITPLFRFVFLVSLISKRMHLRSFFLLLTVISDGAFAIPGTSTGPPIEVFTRLPILNVDIAPDGYTRS
jgi:hypothetical protein